MSGRKRKKNQWLETKRNDGFVRQARRQGYRTRAVFKLEEIDQRDRLISSGMCVVELGAAPGGWSQYVARKVGPKGRIVAVDRLQIRPLQNVHILKGDITDTGIQRQIMQALPGPADLVLSDMAPNITGIKEVDQARFLELLETTLALCKDVLHPGGSVLMKVFEGPQMRDFRSRCEREFDQVQVRKPASSRSNSREYYLLAKGLLREPRK